MRLYLLLMDKIVCFCSFILFNVPVNYLDHCRTVGRSRHTPSGAVMLVTLVINLGGETRILVLANIIIVFMIIMLYILRKNHYNLLMMCV